LDKTYYILNPLPRSESRKHEYNFMTFRIHAFCSSYSTWSKKTDIYLFQGLPRKCLPNLEKIIRPLQCKQRHRLQRSEAITRMAFDLTLPIFNRTIYNPLPPTHLLLLCLDTCWSLTSSFSHHIQEPHLSLSITHTSLQT